MPASDELKFMCSVPLQNPPKPLLRLHRTVYNDHEVAKFKVNWHLFRLLNRRSSIKGNVGRIWMHTDALPIIKRETKPEWTSVVET